MKKIILLCYFFSCFAHPVQGQSVYQLSTNKELPLLISGSLGLGLGVLLKRQKSVLYQQEISRFQPSQVWIGDRFATQFWSPKAQQASDVFLYAAPFSALGLMLDDDIRADKWRVGLVVLETHLVNAALTMLVKETVQRKRPYMYHNYASLAKKMEKDATSSFYSGHTSVVAASLFSTAQIYSDYKPNGAMLPLVWGTAIVIPAITGYLRVRGGKHFLTDVIVGYLAGAAVGILIPRLHRINN